MKKYLFIVPALALAACSSGEVPAAEAVVEPTTAEVVSVAGETAPVEAADIDHVDLLRQLVLDVSSVEEGEAILKNIARTGDTRFVAGLIDVMRYQRPLSGRDQYPTD